MSFIIYNTVSKASMEEYVFPPIASLTTHLLFLFLYSKMRHRLVESERRITYTNFSKGLHLCRT